MADATARRRQSDGPHLSRRRYADAERALRRQDSIVLSEELIHLHRCLLRSESSLKSLEVSLH